MVLIWRDFSLLEILVHLDGDGGWNRQGFESEGRTCGDTNDVLVRDFNRDLEGEDGVLAHILELIDELRVEMIFHKE